MAAFPYGTGGARWHILYDVFAQTTDVRLFTFGTDDWDYQVPNHGVTSVANAGAGAFAACGGRVLRTAPTGTSFCCAFRSP